MIYVMVISAFWTIYGAVGLLGFQIIPERYQGHAWTKGYIRRRGAVWVMLGVPWFVLCMILYDTGVSYAAAVPLLLVFAIPALGYSIFLERKYKAILNCGQKIEEQ